MRQSQLTAEEREPQCNRLRPLIESGDVLSLLLGHETRRRDPKLQSGIAGPQSPSKLQQCA